MSTRYDDRDDRDYDRDSQYYGQYNRRSSLENTRSFGERAENRWGESRGEGRSGEGRYGESGGGGYGGSSTYGRGSYSGGGYGGGSYGGGGYSSGGGRESQRYDREGRGGSDRWSGGGRSYGRESSSGGGRESGREGYWGRGWENERDDDTRESRYGSYGRSGAERGYSEGMRDYSQRYNYPTGFRSGESYGRSYESDREGYDRGEGRGWWDRASDAVASWFGDEDAERRRRMDQQREHRGRGPKGYRRSDERIKEDVNDRLSDDYYIDASDIEVMVSNTEVTLTGTVNSRDDKRRAEDIAESVSGVTNVENRLRVKQGRYGDYSTSSSTGSSMGATGTGTSTDTSSISGTPGTTTSSAAAGGGKTKTT
jgi:osmotically-inducible protein OsmY